jgi:hypothetical protein
MGIGFLCADGIPAQAESLAEVVGEAFPGMVFLFLVVKFN